MILLKPVLPVFDYAINYDTFLQLCENKATPELHCNGKCQLMKELAKESEKEKPLTGKKLLSAEHELQFFQSADIFTFSFYSLLQNKENVVVYTNLYTALSVSSIFHPPPFIS